MQAPRKKHCVVLLVWVLAVSSTSNAAGPPTEQVLPSVKVSESQLIKVTIATSRPEVAGNGAFGIFADFENVSSAPVRLYPGETAMVLQPEVAGDPNCVFSRDGWFPTEPQSSESQPKGGAIVIQPKEKYAVFWDVSRASTARCGSGTEEKDASATDAHAKRMSFFEVFRSWLHDFTKKVDEQLSFVPGDYVFVVDGKAHWMPNNSEEAGYHTFTERVKLHIGLSQMGTMIAAMIGGVVGYFVGALRPGGDLRQASSAQPTKRIQHGFVILRNLLSAMLISAVVTIILSRISDTQFPIKVSVSDFWGALTVGFFAYFLGYKLIDKMVGLVK